MNNQEIFDIVNKTMDWQIKSALIDPNDRFFQNCAKRITKEKLDSTLANFDIYKFLHKDQHYLYEHNVTKSSGNKLIFYKISRLCDFLVAFYRIRHRDKPFDYVYWSAFIQNMIRSQNEDPDNILLLAYDYYKDNIIENCIEYATFTIDENDIKLNTFRNSKVVEYRQKVKELDELYHSISGESLDYTIQSNFEYTIQSNFEYNYDTAYRPHFNNNLVDLADKYDDVPNRSEMELQNKSIGLFLDFLRRQKN